jgi:glyoxylase-like metal-dependent hydrolase (beta-lactamase superfamily II)
VDVRELRPGLWRWTAVHPEWTPDSDWAPEVGCVYWESDDAVCLIDPLVPADEAERFWSALDRDVERAAKPVAVLLTVFWHERSAGEVAARYGGDVWAHESALDRLAIEVARPFQFGDPLPGGIEALDTAERGEVVYWIAGPNAVVAGDVLLGDGSGGVQVCPPDWFAAGESGRLRAKEALAVLLGRPVELVLVSHGEPVVEGARERLAAAIK